MVRIRSSFILFIAHCPHWANKLVLQGVIKGYHQIRKSPDKPLSLVASLSSVNYCLFAGSGVVVRIGTARTINNPIRVDVSLLNFWWNHYLSLWPELNVRRSARDSSVYKKLTNLQKCRKLSPADNSIVHILIKSRSVRKFKTFSRHFDVALILPYSESCCG